MDEEIIKNQSSKKNKILAILNGNKICYYGIENSIFKEVCMKKELKLEDIVDFQKRFVKKKKIGKWKIKLENGALRKRVCKML